MMEDEVWQATNLAGPHVSGYMHPAYAAALGEFGSPLELPGSGGWVLQRAIPGSRYRDAMGCYPLFSCPDWSQLGSDLQELAEANDLVSLAVVTDPFGAYDPATLEACFVDTVIPFKQHFVVDLQQPLDEFVHPHHRRNARKALQNLTVERCSQPLEFLDQWTELYQGLAERHGISGLTAFSRESFAGQLAVPGLVAFRAHCDDSTVGMLLWYVQGDIAYYHLGAYSARGYDLRASFALFSQAIEYFAAQRLQWLNLGGAAGTGDGQTSGLGRFKEGWSTGVRTAYFCGRILDPVKYEVLVRAKRVGSTDYFPAYRLGEFG